MKKLLSILLLLPITLFSQIHPQIGDYEYGGIVFYVDTSNNFVKVAWTSSIGYYSASQAQDAINNFTGGGHDDWVQSSCSDMDIILNELGSNAASIQVNQPNFGQPPWTPNCWYWTSTGAWKSCSEEGFCTNSHNGANPYNVHPIRSGFYGCTDINAFNYDNNADFDNGSCDNEIESGCTDPSAVNYNPVATFNDGSCISEYIYGCMDLTGFNYNSLATINQVSPEDTTNPCIPVQVGCTDLSALNYNPDANVDNGSCDFEIFGCMSDWADNYDPLATYDNESCYKMGCMWFQATNFDSDVTDDDGSCYREGCLSEWADNTDPYLNFNAPYPVEYIDDGSCTLNACMSDWADNYDVNATSDTIDGSCFKEGCMDTVALNYDSFATYDDESCNYPLSFGALQCGQSISVSDSIAGSTPSDLSQYSAFSFEVETDSTYVEIEYELESLCDYYYGSDALIVLFKDGYWFDSYGVYVGCSYSNFYIRNLTLDPGVYTLVYTTRPNYYNYNNTIEEYISSLTYGNNYDSFQIDLSLTMYDGNCFKEGCMDSNALNYDNLATNNDESCNYPLFFGALQCGQSISVSDSIAGNTPSDLFQYSAFSFEVETDSTYVEIEYELESLCDYYGYTDALIVVFKDGYWFDSYSGFTQCSYYYSNEIGNINIPNQLTLDAGEYTFVYSNNLHNYIHGSIEEYMSSLTYNDNQYDSFLIDLSLTMYDGNCFKEGCMDSSALNYDNLATSPDNCNYSFSFGALQCGQSISVSESISLYSNGTQFNGFSFEVETESTYIEIEYELESLCEYYGHTEALIVVFRDGYWFDSYYAYYDCGGYEDANIPYQLTLDSGEYTFVYSNHPYNYNSGGSIEEYISSLTYGNNYDSFLIDLSLTFDENNCVFGCTDSIACNFDAFAHQDDGLCSYQDAHYTCDGECLFDSDNDGVCDEFEILGCPYEWAENYNALATEHDGSCYLHGCSSEWADNYANLATEDDGSCYRNGCMSIWADNYDELATEDDGSCYRLGCTSLWADNYDELATEDDVSCYRNGCMYETMINYDPLATQDDGSCNAEQSYLDSQIDIAISNIQDTIVSITLHYEGQIDSFLNEIVDLDTTLYLALNDVTYLQAQLEEALSNQEDGITQADIDVLDHHIDSLSQQIDSTSVFISSLNMSLANSLSDLTLANILIQELQNQVNHLEDNQIIPIHIDLVSGWNMIGFSCNQERTAVEALLNIVDNLIVFKDNSGNVYLPEYDFNGIGYLWPGHGYQLKVTDAILDFNICE